MKDNYLFEVRVTGVIIENSKILIVKQKVSDKRAWSLPGGRLEHGETLEIAIIREMKEETGLVVKIEKLLYICEKTNSFPPLLHITFLLKKIGGNLKLPTNEYDENPIHDVKYVEVERLEEYDFSDKFKNIVLNEFPDFGSYKGYKKNIGL